MRPLLRLRGECRRLLASLVIEERWLLQGLWFNLLITLGCVHSMAFGAFHMEAFLQRGLAAREVAAVHIFFSVWNPLNDIAAGYIADEWVARGFGSRLGLLAWSHVGWAVSTLLAFQEMPAVPVWLHYAVAIFAADGFGSLANALQTLVFVEQTSEERQRIQIQRLNSVFGCGEWLVMAVAFGLWDARAGHRGVFGAYLYAVCLGSAACTLLGVRGLQHSDATLAVPECSGARSPGAPKYAAAGCEGREPAGQGGAGGLWPFLRAAAEHENFRRYIVVIALLEAETVFCRQFDVVLVRILLCSWSAAARTLLIVGDPLCGAIAFLLTWVAERPEFGTYGVTRATLRLRLGFCLAAAGLLLARGSLAAVGAAAGSGGPAEPYAPDMWLAITLGVLMVLCRAATRPMVSFGGVIFASVIQEHALLEHERRGGAQASSEEAGAAGSAKSSADGGAGKYYMLRAALTKPLNSLGPVVGTAALASSGYRRSEVAGEAASTQMVDARLWWMAASLPVAISLALSLVVCPVWARFSLHGARLEKVAALAEPSRSRSA